MELSSSTSKNSYISGNKTLHFSTSTLRIFLYKNFLYFFLENPSLWKQFLYFIKRKHFLYFRKRNPALLSGSSKKLKKSTAGKFIILQETETPKKSLYFRKRNFLILSDIELLSPKIKKFLIFSGENLYFLKKILYLIILIRIFFIRIFFIRIIRKNFYVVINKPLNRLLSLTTYLHSSKNTWG